MGAAGCGAGPHVNGPGPRVEERGPLGPAREARSGAALAAAAATTAAGVFARGATPNGWRWEQGVEVPGAVVEAVDLWADEATRDEGGVVGGTMLSSARRRSARTSVNGGNGLWRVMSCDMNWYHLLRPRRMFSTSAVLDGLAKVSEGVSHGLHLAAVVIDGEGTLGKGAKLSVEEHGARLAVVQELLLELKPGNPSRDNVTVADDVEEVGGDGVVEPGDNDAIHAGPSRFWKERASPRTRSCKAKWPRTRRTWPRHFEKLEAYRSRTRGTKFRMFWTTAAWLWSRTMAVASEVRERSSSSRESASCTPESR